MPSRVHEPVRLSDVEEGISEARWWPWSKRSSEDWRTLSKPQLAQRLNEISQEKLEKGVYPGYSCSLSLDELGPNPYDKEYAEWRKKMSTEGNYEIQSYNSESTDRVALIIKAAFIVSMLVMTIAVIVLFPKFLKEIAGKKGV